MNVTIGRRIRSFRENKGFSQDDMAERLNISQSAYSRIEKGETNNWIPLIPTLCTQLDVTPEDLFASDSVELVQNNNDSASSVQNHTQHDTHIIINHLPEKLLAMYEEKIKLLEVEIESLKKKK